MTLPSLDDLSQKTGLPLQASQDLQVSLVHDLLVSLHRSSDKPADRARNDRIETVYKQLFNEDLPTPSAPAVIPTLALGLPGTGLNATFHAAARQTADLLGMALKVHPSDDDPLGPNDLVVRTLEVPAQALGNTPEQDERFVQRLTSTLQQGGGGLFMLDFDNLSGADAVARLMRSLPANVLPDAGVLLGGAGIVQPEAALDVSADTRAMFRPVLMTPRPILGHKLSPVVGTVTAGASATLQNRVTDMAINAQLQQRFPSLATLVKKLDQSPTPDRQDPTPSMPSRRQP